MSHDETPDGRLTAALRAVAEDDASSRGASDSVRAQLMSQLRTASGERRRRSFVWLAAAAAILLAAALALWRLGGRVDAPSQVRQPTAVGARTEETTEFFPLISAAMPLEGSHLIRIDVPRRALASFGLAAAEEASDDSGTVVADLLVGNDGLARAVRFVRPMRGQEKH